MILIEKILNLPLESTGHIIIMAGGASSGKTTAIGKFTNIKDKSTIVDIDKLKRYVLNSEKLKKDFFKWLNKRQISGYELVDLSPSNMSDSQFSTLIHEYVLEKEFIDKKLKKLATNLPNITLDTTFRNVNAIASKLEELYQKGYSENKTHLVYVYSCPNTSLKRNRSRSRVEPDEFVIISHDAVLSNIKDILKSKQLPHGITGSFSIIINNENTNYNDLEYFKIMVDNVWNDNEISKFREAVKISERNKVVYEDIDNCIEFSYFGTNYKIVKSDNKFILLYNKNNKEASVSSILGLKFIFDSSSTLEEVMDKLSDIPFIREKSHLSEARTGNSLKAGMIPYYINNDDDLMVYCMIPSDPAYGGVFPQMAKGMVDVGDTIEETAWKEAEEELGLFRNNVNSKLFLTKEEYDTSGVDSPVLYVYACEIVNPNRWGKPHYETGWSGWINYTKNRSKIRENQVKFFDILNSKVKK